MRLHPPALLLLAVLAASCGGSSGPPLGPPAPVRDTVRVYAGTVRYFTTGPRLSQRDANGRLLAQAGFVNPTIPRTAPRFLVEILDGTGALLETGTTDANGNYSVSVNYGKNPAVPVTIRVVARLDIPGGSVVRVYPNASATQPYSKSSPLLIDINSETIVTDITIQLAEGAGAFHILDTCYEGLVAINSGVLGALSDIDVYWEPGNGAQSTVDASQTTVQIMVAGGVAGDPSSNTDVWDAPEILRLLGRYFLEVFSADVSPAGTADDALLVPSAAWREGFLDFFSCAVRNSPESWDTQGSGASGRVTRYFNLESYFDPALGSLGPDDPNVYQAADHVGIGSRFTIGEVLWDIFDGTGVDTDGDPLAFPFFLTLRCLEGISQSDYPYFYTLLEDYVSSLSLTAVQIDAILLLPEDQGIHYPPSAADGTVWPERIVDPAFPNDPVAAGFDGTVSGTVDTITPVPLNPEIGLQSQIYFSLRTGVTALLDLDLTTTGALRVELLDTANNVLASGTAGLVVPILDAGRYVIRVLPDGGAAVNADFDLRVQVN